MLKVWHPDHDFSVGSQHFLVPSMMARCKIEKDGGVSYSGETYISIRSSKHNNLLAFSHQEDILRMRDLNLMPDHFKGKHILVKNVDGGPDENPWFQKNQLMCLKTMKVKS